LLINGGFDVWQRGTSGFTSGGIYTADRWRFDSSGSTTAVAKETANPELGNVLSASSNTVSNLVSQYIENGGQYLYNKHHTVSFWVKADAPCVASLRIRNNTTATNYEDFGYNVTTGWTKITYTFSPYTGFSPTDVVRLYLVNNTSVATKIYFAQVQLELGKVATPFEHRSYGEELALCQRYFCKTYSDGTAIGTATSTGAIMSVAYGTISYASAGTWQFPVEMRAAPTVTLYSTANANTTGKVTADSTDGAGVASSISTNSAVIYRGNDSTGVSASVFIKAQATANAEL
jgi:VCBS repeat-containing protein